MRNIKKILAILVVFGMLFSSSCIWQERKIDKYDTYVCYDPNLSYLKADPFIEGKYSEGFLGKTIHYRQIKGADSDQFVLGLFKFTDMFNNTEAKIRVFQNRDAYFSVIDNWTISDVQLCLEEYEDRPRTAEVDFLKHFTSLNLPSKNRKKVVGEYGDLISEFQELREGEADPVPPMINEWALRSGSDKDLRETDDRLYLRITFEESENIIWEAPLTCDIVDGEWVVSALISYPVQEAEELDDRTPFLSAGTHDCEFRAIPQGSELYKRISEYADLLVEKHK